MREPETPPGPNPSQEPLSVCLVEYHPVAALHLERLLGDDPGLELVPHAELLGDRRGPKPAPAVFVLDRGSLPIPLSQLLRVVRVRFPEAKSLVLDEPQPQAELFRLLFLGIQGFLPYSQVDAHLVAAVRHVARGGLWLAPQLLEQYIRSTARLSRARRARGAPLTSGEQRTLELVRRRLSNKEIGSILGISEHTVKFHLANVFTKLGVADRDSAAELAAAQALRDLLPEKSK